MEIIRKRVLLLGVILCVVGVGFAVASQFQKPKFNVTEKWMESKAPPTVDDYHFIPSPQDPQESYKMDQDTYDTLQPFGIVSRVYQNESKVFDAVLIASDKRESFHSPNVCLPAQGWTMSNERDEMIHTKSRGTIPITIAELLPPKSEPQAKQYIAFFYRVQDKIIARSGASIFVLTLAMFEGPIRGNFDENTVFYRITSRYQGATKADLRKFVADYLDSAYATSGGYF